MLASGAQAGPQAACATVYPSTEIPPVIAILQGQALEHWQPPACSGWSAAPSKLVVTLSGSFHFDGPMSVLVARVGTISALQTIRYWSTTQKRWGSLSKDSSALTGPDAKLRRRDFSASELGKGAELYYWEDDANTGPAIYRLRVMESTPERFVISSDNVTPIRRFFLTLFPPGALQSLLVVERVSPGLFGAFVVSRSGEGASLLTGGHEKSYVNRAVALYRHLAGIRADMEPPAAP